MGGGLSKAAEGGAPSPRAPDTVNVVAARKLNRAAGVLATSVLADSSISHYRGSFHNKAMVTPIVTALASLAASVHGHGDRRPARHIGRDLVYAGAALTGLIGTGFHLFNIAKRPGGVSPQNLFYAAPLGAPAALILSGAMGFLAERLREARPLHDPTLLGVPAGRIAAAASGVGLLGTAAEAGLLHLRGAFHDPFMFLPVSVPPVAAVLMGAAAVEGEARRRPFADLVLRATVGLGVAGVAFHTLGVARNMDGWRNWRQNLLNGPPIPAPPSFTGLAMAGLAALSLLGRKTVADRYPGYDVLDKRWTESWNAPTRAAIDKRLSISPEPRFFTAPEWKTLTAVCDRILPQPPERPKAPLAAYVDAKMADDDIDGYRYAELPPQGEAWRRGLAALDEAARAAHGADFADIEGWRQDDLLKAMQTGDLTAQALQGMPTKPFFAHRVLHDVTGAYYALPRAWSEIGFGGPASPRGYVRMDLDRRDPWEAIEATGKGDAEVAERNARVG